MPGSCFFWGIQIVDWEGSAVGWRLSLKVDERLSRISADVFGSVASRRARYITINSQILLINRQIPPSKLRDSPACINGWKHYSHTKKGLYATHLLIRVTCSSHAGRRDGVVKSCSQRAT